MVERDTDLTIDEVASLADKVNRWEQREEGTNSYGLVRVIDGALPLQSSQDPDIKIRVININPVTGGDGSITPKYGVAVTSEGVLVSDPAYASPGSIHLNWSTMNGEGMEGLCKRIERLYLDAETARFNASVRAAREAAR